MCSRCEKDDADCVFDVGDGMTRMQGLQQQLEQRTEDHDRLMVLMNALQHSSDDIATLLLARLRIGESIDELISSIESGEQLDALDQQYQPPTTGASLTLQPDLWPDLNPQNPDTQAEESPTFKGGPSLLRSS